jgi:predicted ATP-dependent serine protease
MPKSSFVCQSCGFKSFKYMGRCTECGAWESFVEEVEAPKAVKGRRPKGSGAQDVTLKAVTDEGASPLLAPPERTYWQFN